MLDIVVDFIDAIIPGQPFLLAGVSYGGISAEESSSANSIRWREWRSSAR
jgi:hypothetical protein